MSPPDPTLVQHLARALASALGLAPAVAVVLSFLIAGGLVLAVVGLAVQGFSRFTTTKRSHEP